MKSPDPPAVAAVIFDLDGTLINTSPLILATYRQVLAGLPPGPAGDSLLLEFFGLPLGEAIAGIQRRLGSAVIIDEEVVALVEQYRQHNHRLHDELIESFVGVEAALAELRGRGYRVGVVTSKRRALALRGLRHYGLDAWVEAFVAADDCERLKPHPEPILRALGALGVPPDRAVYVGDTPVDVAAGRAAGVLALAAGWGPCPADALHAAGPHRLLESIQDLLDLLPDRAASLH